MIAYVRAYLRDLRVGARILCSREFWRFFWQFYNVTIWERLDAWTKEQERRRNERD